MFARTAQRQFRPGDLYCLAHAFSSTAAKRTDFTHVVIGGGVVGLAVARALASHSSSSSHSSTSATDSTLLLEQHPLLGTETSSRNSEVVHAGLYYGRDSLKARLCVRGRRALYAFCERRAVPHRRTGKWVVAQDEAQLDVLRRIHELTDGWGEGEGGSGSLVPTRWVGPAEAAREEPAVRARAGILESGETGIVDSHALMLALRGLFEDEGGTVAVCSRVVGIEPLGGSSSSSTTLPGSSGYRLSVRDTRTGALSHVTASTLVNSAGLGAARVHNMLAPPARRTRLYYAKGNYFSYASPARRVRRLVYPVAPPGAGGLGTHLTLDMAGRVRFGPDVEWIEGPDDSKSNGDGENYNWDNVYKVDASRLPAAVREIKKYLPSLDETALAPDYAGVRPKLRPAGAVATGGGGFVDFYIRKEDGFEGWVNLLGIESPGLTSSLAIGDMVRDMLYGSSKVEGSAAL